MATEQEATTTTAPATETTQTTPPTPGETTASADPAALAGVPKSDHRAQVLAKLAARHVESTVTTKTELPATVETTKTEPAKEGEAVSTEAEAAESVEGEQKADGEATEEAKTEEAKPADDDPSLVAARRLNELAQRGRAFREQKAREARESAARVAAIQAKEAEVAKREKEASEKTRAIQEAIASGSKLAVLRAAGISDKDLVGGTWLFDAMQEAGEAEDPEKQPPAQQKLPNPVLTAEQVAEIVRKNLEEAEKAKKEALQKQKQEEFSVKQVAFLTQVEEEYARGNYPHLKALPERVRPKLKHMDECLTEIYNATKQGLTPAELLELYENDLKESGTVVPKAKTTKPAPKPPVSTPSATKTTTQAAVQASTQDKPTGEDTKREKSIHELREEGWEAAQRRLAERRAARSG